MSTRSYLGATFLCADKLAFASYRLCRCKVFGSGSRACRRSKRALPPREVSFELLLRLDTERTRSRSPSTSSAVDPCSPQTPHSAPKALQVHRNPAPALRLHVRDGLGEVPAMTVEVFNVVLTL